MDLKTLMIDSKAVWIDFPGLDGFQVEIANLSRKELTALRKKCTGKKFDRQTRQLIETLDDERFVKEFTSSTIKNWRGLKLMYLESLLLVNIDGQDPEADLDFSLENASELVNGSAEFDTWLNEVVFDLDNFRAGPKARSPEKARGNVPKP